MTEIKLGQKVKDSLTGNTGTVVARTTWLHGCVRVVVQPEGSKDGAPLDVFSIDEPQVVVIDKKPAPKARPSHGPKPIPTRAPDPRR